MERFGDSPNSIEMSSDLLVNGLGNGSVSSICGMNIRISNTLSNNVIILKILDGKTSFESMYAIKSGPFGTFVYSNPCEETPEKWKWRRIVL